MRIRNADGSEPEMCGNGIRCVARYLHERGRRAELIRIETAAGVLDCAIAPDLTVAVEMGRPVVPWSDPALALGDRRFAVTHVTLGNPHAVTFVDGGEDLRALAERYGPLLERHERFPQRTNAEFARVAGDALDLCVWERGCGITLACGTGASATAAAAVATGRLPAGREIEVRLPGGALFIRVAPDLAGVRMRGPAVEVAEVEVEV
jgi:diaminopimelate epimerase